MVRGYDMAAELGGWQNAGPGIDLGGEKTGFSGHRARPPGGVWLRRGMKNAAPCQAITAPGGFRLYQEPALGN